MIENARELTGFIWSIAELLRGDYKQADYGKIILPFTVLRRIDCILENDKEDFFKKYNEQKNKFGGEIPEAVINSISKKQFYNISSFTLKKLLEDSEHIKSNLISYIEGYSNNVRDIMGHFDIERQIDKLDKSNLLYLIVEKFSSLDLHPNKINSMEMGYAFEELIRKFSEISNETSGEHFTPREVIELMVNIIFNTKEEEKHLTKEGKIIKIYDPACGTGGMLSVADNHLKELNSDITTVLFGQELNPESSAICNSDMIIKGQNIEHIIYGDTLKNDGLKDERFDYMLCNPPFGVEWKKQEKEIKDEYQLMGYNGRFGAGLPRINDGSLLFLEHMLSKMQNADKNGVGGSRIAIIFNGSPLFTGGAGSGESNIRKWIVENDWLEAIIALPTELFYNTGIATYIWVLTNRKEDKRKGKIQLINAVGFYEKMRKSLGNKRSYLTEHNIHNITNIYGKFAEGEFCKIFDNDDFGYERITVECPLRLRFDITNEALSKLQETNGFLNLAKSRKKGIAGEEEIKQGQKLQKQIIDILKNNLDKSWNDEAVFSKEIKQLFNGIKVDTKLLKMLIDGLGEQDENAEIVKDSKGNPKPNTNLRDNENVPLKENIEEYFKREVLPYVPDAWIDYKKQTRGYEIPFTRHFYKYTPPRDLEKIETELQKVQNDILKLMGDVL